MPELPEVETLRRSLLPHVIGQTIVAVRPGAFPAIMGEHGVAAGAARIVGRTIVRLRRRGKYLLLDLDNEMTLMVHLRMTGNLLAVPRSTPPLRFEHLALELDSGIDLRYTDQRKFGRVIPVLPVDVRHLQRRLGPEPLSRRFTAARLQSALARRPGKIKSVLLDQRLVAGLGNIYVDEALFRARIHPERGAHDLSKHEVSRLHRAIRMVLREGLLRRGTTLSSFHDAAGEAGENQANLRVYGRGVEAPCLRCGQPLNQIVVGGRGTTYCPCCQPREAAP